MKASTTATLLATAAVASAQVALPSTIPILGYPFGQECQQTVLGLFTNGSFSQCFPASALLPLLTSSDNSIVPVLDNFMTELCYNQPCSNDTLTQAAQQISQGCASDLQASNITADTITMIFDIYPTLREVLCLKTTDYYTAESYGGFLGAPPIPISDAYNLTDGAFCVSSVLTQLSAYFGSNLTISYIEAAATGQNQTAVDLLTSIQPNILCNGCIFGAVDVLVAAYPGLANVTAAQVFGYINMTLPSSVPEDTTLPDVMDSTCAYVPLSVNSTVLPPGVSISIVNSTFPNAPANGEPITESTPTPEEPTSPQPSPSAPAGLPEPSEVVSSASAAASEAPTPSADASGAPAVPSVDPSAVPSASLPAVDPSATPAPPAASASA